ncbi:MAG TPA: ribosome maturation factor RimM [Steroidobacteraceae bacterium]|jgi:16S rRNA processing protein RimM|nr:ribosome maturation factor RimM [Steroidobacteraceae bacterium]
MSDESSALIQLGFVGAPFGVRGWVKLRSHTDPPERLLKHRNLQIGREGAYQSYRIVESGRSGGALTVKLAGVEDRDQAMALRGAQICVPRTELPERDDKDFYRADLIGCDVVNLAGVGLGVVQHFVETPAQVLMVVRGEREYWVPAVAQHLRRVDLQARRVTVDWDAAAE